MWGRPITRDSMYILFFSSMLSYSTIIIESTISIYFFNDSWLIWLSYIADGYILCYIDGFFWTWFGNGGKWEYIFWPAFFWSWTFGYYWTGPNLGLFWNDLLVLAVCLRICWLFWWIISFFLWKFGCWVGGWRTWSWGWETFLWFESTCYLWAMSNCFCFKIAFNVSISISFFSVYSIINRLFACCSNR